MACGRDRELIWSYRIGVYGVFMANLRVVLGWEGYKLGTVSSNNEERAAQNGHELIPGVTEKATAKRSWGKSSFILIFMLIFKRFDTIVDFPGRFWKTLPMQNSITACGKLCTELWATLGCFGTLLPFNWPLRGGAGNWAKVGFPKQFPCPIWHNTGAVSSVTTSKWLITRDEETEEADRLYELRIWAD